MAPRFPHIARTGLIGMLPALQLTVLLCLVSFLQAAPAAAPSASEWELDFKAAPLRLFQDPLTDKYYWYLSYEVTNSTGKDVVFAPKLEILSAKGELMDSGTGVSSTVKKGVRRQVVSEEQDELLFDDIQIIGPLLQGRENTKIGFAIWPAVDVTSDREFAGNPNTQELDAPNHVDVFVTGLTNAYRNLETPDSEKSRRARQTLLLTYVFAGDSFDPGSGRVAKINQKEGAIRARAFARDNMDRIIRFHAKHDNGVWIWR